ncbi:unnamed protein product [Coregonus sp. 'balchen']|nr:unnamed protein product [Coregonus sp. 'balchen']
MHFDLYVIVDNGQCSSPFALSFLLNMRAGLLAAVMCLWTCLVLFLCPLYRCTLLPPCDSEIYCYGDILRQVQTAKLFDDDKYFVDMKLKSAPEQYSQIFTPHPVIVPGGRFRELYYWDSYWVINGLLLSEMTDTARGMILNFVHLINRYGFIPNGGRVYYERRSQPPFLSLMVESYYQTTKDKELLRTALPALEQEYLFWMQNRSVAVEVNGRKHVLNRFDVQVGLPRCCREAVDRAEFRSRVRVGLLVSLVCGRPGEQQRFSERHQHQSVAPYRPQRSALSQREDPGSLLQDTGLEAIETVLWDEERGVWLDYSLVTNTSCPAFYPSNLAPIWAACYSHPSMGQKALHYLQASGGLAFPNGVPTSLVESLSSLPSQEARELGFELAQSWIRTNWLAYVKYEAMFEKYDVNGDGKPGGGGEYDVQLGFGWTNGVALQLLDQYGDRLTSGSSGDSCTLCFSATVALLCSVQTLFLSNAMGGGWSCP